MLAYTLVQLAATLAMLAGQGTALPTSTRAQALTTSMMAVQSSVWLTKTQSSTPLDINADIDKLYRAQYLTDAKQRVPLGTPIPGTGAVMSIVDEYVSFGDLDSDTMHDAMPIIKMTYPNGKVDYHLAAMRNFGGVLVNSVNQQLEPFDAIYSHHIADKGLYLDFKPTGKPRTTVHFILHPNYTEPQPAFVITRNPDFDGVIAANTNGARVASFLLFCIARGTRRTRFDNAR